MRPFFRYVPSLDAARRAGITEALFQRHDRTAALLAGDVISILADYAATNLHAVEFTTHDPEAPEVALWVIKLDTSTLNGVRRDLERALADTTRQACEGVSTETFFLPAADRTFETLASAVALRELLIKAEALLATDHGGDPAFLFHAERHQNEECSPTSSTTAAIKAKHYRKQKPSRPRARKSPKTSAAVSS
jgi:hypothetical protein